MAKEKEHQKDKPTMNPTRPIPGPVLQKPLHRSEIEILQILENIFSDSLKQLLELFFMDSPL